MQNKLKIFYLFIFCILIIVAFNVSTTKASIKNNFMIDDTSESKRLESDVKILKSIRDIIYQYDPVLIQDIRIKINSGIVSIYGTFSTLTEREKTIGMIKTIEGVRGIIDYTILTPIARDDDEIENDIFVSLLHNPCVYAPRVKIHVLNGAVRLTGRVANEWEREEALHTAKGILGVFSVTDHLVIDSNIRLSNIQYTDAIKAMVKYDPYCFDDAINIRTDADIIIIEGTVDTSFEKNRLETMVAKLGIENIKNQIEIEGNIPICVQKQEWNGDDREILNTIKAMIEMDERIAPQDFNIFVNNGNVTLYGTIQDIYQKWFLEHDVLSVFGVQRVENTLMTQNTTRTDEDIIKDLKRILHSEPSLATSDIMMTCHDGTVVLTGTTDSNMNRILVERIAAQISGIQDINNHMRIVYPSLATSVINKNGNDPNILIWDMHVGHETFRIYVDQNSKTIIIRGQATCEDEKNKAEQILQLRAPEHFKIINEISIGNYF